MQVYGFEKPPAGISLLLGVIAILQCSIPVMAQEANAEESIELATITVTAPPLNKGFEVNAGAFGAKDTMDVPLAIQSYSAKAIADASARTARNVLGIDPSILNSSYGGGFDNFRMRGFAMDNFNTIRRDGLALAPHYDVPLELIERIDVLKGPSGFLYGFNSPGGTINYIPKRPTRDSFTQLTLQGTSLQGRYAAVDTSASLADGAFGYRINAGTEKVGDFNHLGDLERNFVGVANDFRVSDKALLQLTADWAWKSAMADPLLRADQSARENALDPSTYVLPPRVDRRDALSPSWYRHKTEAANMDLKFDYSLDNHWTSITQANYSRVERHGGYVDLFDIQTNGDIGYVDLYNSRGEVFSTGSLQSYLAGKFTAGSVFHDVFVGASHRQFRDKSPYWDFVESTGDISVSDISVGNIRNPVQPPRWDFGPRQATDYHSSIRESSVFASDLMALKDELQILVGGRYIKYEARELSAEALPQDKSVFVPTGALIFRPSESLMTYVSYSRGFEKGEYAPFNAVNANEPTDAIQSWQYEIGFKADVNHRFNVGVALFDIERDAAYLDTANVYVSDGSFHHQGIEVNTTAGITRGLSVLGNFAYLDTELTAVADATTLHKRSEGVPNWKASGGARYAFTGVPGLSVDTMLSYVGSRPVDAQNSGFISAYTLLDAGVSYEATLGTTPATFRLHAANLTDKYYYAGVFYSGGLDVGRGREIFLSTQLGF